MIDYENIIKEIRNNFTKCRDSHSDFSDSYLSCKRGFREKLLNRDDRYDQFYTDQEMIYKHGRIVWGHIIQANNALYEPGTDDLPAAIIYSDDPEMDKYPHLLDEYASSLYHIKGQATTPELSEFSRKLADEIESDWKLKIPKSLTGVYQCYYLTNMIFRKHLPDGFLESGLFPIMIYPEKTDVGFVLPSQFWTKDFIADSWKQHINYGTNDKEIEKLTLSEKKLKEFKKELPLGHRLFSNIAYPPKMLEEYLATGEVCGAVVITAAKELIVAVHSDEFDCVMLLKFPRRLITQYNLRKKSKLISVNIYEFDKKLAKDIQKGSASLSNYTNIFPLIGDFLSDDIGIIDEFKQEMDHWDTIYEMGIEKLKSHGVSCRNGSPYFSDEPA